MPTQPIPSTPREDTDHLKRLLDPANTDCVCIVSHFAPLSEQVGPAILWLPPQATAYLGRDDVTNVTDMACSTVQIGLTHFTMGCKASQGAQCSCFVLLDNVGEGLCIAKSRSLDIGQFVYLKNGEYFILGRSDAFLITIISDQALLNESRRQLRDDLRVLRLHRNWRIHNAKGKKSKLN